MSIFGTTKVTLNEIYKEVHTEETRKFADAIHSCLNKAKACGLKDWTQALMMTFDIGYEKISGGIWTKDTYLPYIKWEDKNYYIRKNPKNLLFLTEANRAFCGAEVLPTKTGQDCVLLYCKEDDSIMYTIFDYYYGSEITHTMIIPSYKAQLMSEDGNEDSSWLGAGFCPINDFFEKRTVLMLDTKYHYIHGKFVENKETNEIEYFDPLGRKCEIEVEYTSDDLKNI